MPSVRFSRVVALLPVVLSLAGCRAASKPDAYGSFEAIEVVVSSQTTGPIERFLVSEGSPVERGAVVVIVDSTAMVLEQQQLAAQRAAVTSRRAEVAEQLRALEAQQDIAARTYERTKRLHDQQAATSQQLDQAERDQRTLAAQLDAARASQRSIALDADAVQARIAQTRDRIGRSRVVNPVGGTVLATYAREGEMVAAGQPLYKVASLDTLDLRAYVSGAQLAAVRVGQRVSVRIDGGPDSLVALPGTVTWVSSKSEFTPTPVQTRDERTSLVYAIKVRVANRNGLLKIGMPADVSLAEKAS